VIASLRGKWPCRRLPHFNFGGNPFHHQRMMLLVFLVVQQLRQKTPLKDSKSKRVAHLSLAAIDFQEQNKMNIFNTVNQFDAIAAFSMCVQNFLNQIPVEERLAAQGIAILDDYDFSSCNPIGYSDYHNTKKILAAIASTGNFWTLKRTEAKNDTTNQKTEIFRMTQKDSKTFCDFVLSQNTCHVVMFKVSAEAESKFWIAQRDFKNFFQTMMNAGCEMVRGNALDNTDKNPLHNRPEWRNLKVNFGGKQRRKLECFWLRLGGIFLDGSLVFLSPRNAHIAKNYAIANDEPNPYRFLARSVYGDDERELKKV
jgi:hypothetical protein